MKSRTPIFTEPLLANRISRATDKVRGGNVPPDPCDPDVVLFDCEVEIDRLTAEVARLSALVPRWVPVGERGPKEDREYEITVRDGRSGVAFYQGWREAGQRWWSVGHPAALDATHWLEVPIPPLPGTEP